MRTEGFRSALLSALAIAVVMITSMAFVISTTTVSAPSTFSASPGATLSPTTARANTRVKFTVTVTNDYAADNIDNVLLIGPGFTQPTDLELTTWVLSEITNGVRFDAIGDNVITPGGSKTFVFLWTTPNIPADYMISVLVSKEEPVYTAYENLGGFMVTIEGLTPRAPIYIEGNAGFTKPDPVNGGGSGTENDPYIIENWDINAENAHGIWIGNTTAYFIIRNCLVENGGGAYAGIYLDNAVNGKIENNTVGNNYYGISLGYSDNNLVTNNSCSNNFYGISLYYSSDNNTLTNNTCSGNGYGFGIILWNSSSNNTLTNNSCSGSWSGIYLGYSFINTLTGNTCSGNSNYGIYLYYSSINTLTGNTCSNNSDRGIRLCNSSINTLTNNSFYSNTYGICLEYSSDNNALANNICENNGDGILLSTSSNNCIYHNNFVNNSTQANDDSSNYWDNGYPSGGNYWSDYTGVDENRGENQDIPGSDGIGDTHYVIPPGYNRDRYPLMEPWTVGVPEVIVIAEGKDTAYNTNLEGDPPLKDYASSPPVMIAAKVGSGAVVATGTVSTCRDTRWNDVNNPNPNFDVLLDKAFQWMTTGKKVLWFEGYGVYNRIDTPEVTCQQLEDALEAKGYTLTGDATTPITSGLLSGYDILIIPQMMLGDGYTGGNPALLPDSDVQAIVDFVSDGGGLLIMESSDYGGHNYCRVQNKILKALGAGFYFQHDQVQDDTNNWGGANYQPIADVDTTTDIGSAYQSETGKNEIGLYSICSLRMEVDYEVSVRVSPTINVGGAGEVLTYDATITNIGTKSDNYTLTSEDELGWPITLSENEVSLESGESVGVEVSITVPENLTEKMVNWITLEASGVSGAEDNARFRAVNIFPLEEPPYPVVRPDVTRFLGPGLPTLLANLPAVPIITAIETGFSVDLTPRDPWPILYGKGEFAPVGAAELTDNGRVIALPTSILRDAYYDRSELANDEVMSMIVRWMIDWGDPREHSLLYYVTEGSYHLPPGTGAPIVAKYIYMLEGDLGFEVGTQVGGEITPELIENYDVLQLAELTRPLSHEEIQAVVDYVNDGGRLIIMCQADYGGIGRPKYPNALLEALGSGIRFQDDELYDEDSWVVDGPWFPQVYLLDPREANSEFDVWFPEHDFAIYMPVRSMTLENARALFTTILTNGGTADSTYTIEVTEIAIPENLGWDIEVKQTEIEVAAGENVEIYVVVTVPDIEAGRKRMNLKIEVTDAVQDYLTRNEIFAVLAEDGRMPPEAKFEVGQRVYHVDWGEVTIVDVAWGGRNWAYIVETADGELKLAAEGELAEIPPAIEWDAYITATFSIGSDDAIFGVRPDATSGFDYAYDIPEPPVPPEPPLVRAYFDYPEQTLDELHRSCMAPENLMEWPLRIEYVDNIENVALTWSVENVPTEYNVLLYREGNLVANMRVDDNYTFEASTRSYDFRIVVGRIVPFTLELSQGWNMISFPILPENMSPDSIFDDYYVLYGWDAENKCYMLHADSGSFIEPDPDVEVGVGYWAHVLEDENVDMLGVPVNQLTLSLYQGWNLIGPPYGGLGIADPADDPDDSVLPWVFTWNAREKSYSMTQFLEAGKGYWAHAFQDCTLELPLTIKHALFAFYYPWYGTPYVSGYWFHWNEAGHNPNNFIDGRRDIAAKHYPSLGVYDSKNVRLIEEHIDIAKRADIDAFVVSWWGINSFEDDALSLIKNVCEESNFKFTIYYETTSSLDSTLNDMRYLLDKYANSRSWYRIDDRPVIFIYGRARDQLNPPGMCWTIGGEAAFWALSEDIRRPPRYSIFVIHPYWDNVGFVQSDRIDLPSNETYTLKVSISNMRNDCPPYSDVGFRIKIENETGGWVTLDNLVVNFDDGWLDLAYDISSFAGQTVSMRVESYAGGAEKWCSEWAAVDYFYIVNSKGEIINQYPYFDSGWRSVVEDLNESGYNPYFIIDFGGYGGKVQDFAEYYLNFTDGIHTYAIMSDISEIYNKASEAAHSKNKIFVATVMPGYDDTEVRSPGYIVERENGSYYTSFWSTAISSSPDHYIITSFNEWHEGSEIEPSLEYGYEYIDLTSNLKKING